MSDFETEQQGKKLHLAQTHSQISNNHRDHKTKIKIIIKLHSFIILIFIKKLVLVGYIT